MSKQNKCPTTIAEIPLDSLLIHDSLSWMPIVDPNLPYIVQQKFYQMINYFCIHPDALIPEGATKSTDPLINQFLQDLPFVAYIPQPPLGDDFMKSGVIPYWLPNPFKYNPIPAQEMQTPDNIPCSETFTLYVDPQKTISYKVVNSGYHNCVNYWTSHFERPGPDGTCISSVTQENPVTGQMVTMMPSQEQKDMCIAEGGHYDETEPIPPTPPTPPNPDDEKGGMSTAAIVGISVGAVAFLGIVGLIFGTALSKKKQNDAIEAAAAAKLKKN